MWLYIPPGYCPSAPESEDSISASVWQARTLERSATLSEMPLPYRSWLRRLKKDSWMQPLSGAICPPSTAPLGAAEWIGSLAEYPASPTATQEPGREKKTPATSGRTPPEFSPPSDPASSSWRMFQESQGITTNALNQTCEEWVTGLRKAYSRRLKSAPRMEDSDSSPWHTPAADQSTSDAGVWNGLYYIRKDGTKVTSVHTHQVANWPTPRSSDHNNASMNSGERHDLRTAIRLWPTLTARDEKDRGHAQEERESVGPALGRMVLNWRTPGAIDSKEGVTGTGRDFVKLTEQVIENHFGRLALLTSSDGHDCSTKCRRLNPLFVEWLMGLPPLWSLLNTALIDFVEWGTLLSHWLRQQRSALSQLAP